MLKFQAVNEKKLFENIECFFERPEGALIEIAQNAYRAGATSLNINIDKNILKAEDNGHGIDSIVPLFCLSDSAWSRRIEEEQMPAGWGLFFIMSISEKILYQSAFGSIEVDCHKYLRDPVYREGLLNLVKPKETATGFRLVTELKDGVAERICDEYRSLVYFPLDITINGEKIKRHSLSEKTEEGYTALEYRPGCTIYLKPLEPEIFLGGKVGYEGLGVVYHGIPINMGYTFITKIYINITEGSPLTPVLPYRTAIKKDNKMNDMIEFIRQYKVKKIFENLNNNNNSQDEKIRLYRLAEDVMTQAQIDSLPEWYLKVNDHNDWHKNYTRYILIRKGDVPPVSVTKLEIKGDNEHPEFYDVITENDITVTVCVPKRRPHWLTIKEEKIVVNVNNVKEQPAGLEFTWKKTTRIAVGDREVYVVATVNEYGDITVYYKESPRDIMKIYDNIFNNICCEDEDYDTQEECFQKRVSEDIQCLTGLFKKADILRGFYGAGISPYDILSLSLEGNTIRLSLRGGTKRVLSLAA